MTDSKDSKAIKLFKQGQYAGVLERTTNGCQIIFDDLYFTENLERAFTYNTKISKKIITYQGLNLPPYFAGLLPEGLRLKALVRRLKTSEDDMFSLLANSGSSSIGDIYFSEEIVNSQLALPKSFAEISKELHAGSNPNDGILAGVQDKVSADRISLPLSGVQRNKSYILKLGSKDFPQAIQNEFLSLKIAKACGLSVNNAKVIHDEEHVEALLIERFDRQWNKENKSWSLFHQEDACQFLDSYPADKYRISMQEVAEGILQLATTPQIEILRLLELTAFSYVFGNGDLHAKNISLIDKNEITQLSPVYDVLCTALYGDQKMALMMDGKNENWKRKSFVDFGIRYGVSEAAIDSMLNNLLKKFDQHKDTLFELPLAQEKRVFLESFWKKRMEGLT